MLAEAGLPDSLFTVKCRTDQDSGVRTVEIRVENRLCVSMINSGMELYVEDTVVGTRLIDSIGTIPARNNIKNGSLQFSSAQRNETLYLL